MLGKIIYLTGFPVALYFSIFPHLLVYILTAIYRYKTKGAFWIPSLVLVCALEEQCAEFLIHIYMYSPKFSESQIK